MSEEEERCHLHCEHTLITPPPSPHPALHHSSPPLLRHLTHSITKPPPILFLLVCVRLGPVLTNPLIGSYRKHLSHSESTVVFMFLSVCCASVNRCECSSPMFPPTVLCWNLHTNTLKGNLTPRGSSNRTFAHMCLHPDMHHPPHYPLISGTYRFSLPLSY